MEYLEKDIESVATNASLIIYVEDKGLMLINYSDAPDMYLPFYTTNIFDVSFSTDNVVSDVENFCKKNNVNRESKKDQLIESFKKEFDVENFIFSDLIYSYNTIKYSKTGLNNRFYSMDFYCLKYVSNVDKIINNRYDHIFTPINYNNDSINDKYIVDNVLYMMRNEDILDKIKENMLKKNKLG